MNKILIVEDDVNIATGLEDNLKMEGFRPVLAHDGEEALKKVKAERPDLIILDIMLPKLSGLEVCRRLKEQGNKTPVIILSAMGQESDKVAGLELGADDYVTKPFSPRELVTRVKAVLRRLGTPKEAREVYDFGAIKADFRKYQVFKDGKELKFTSAEFKILKLLFSSAGEPVSRHTILGDIWSEDVTTRTVDTHIWSIREKLEDDPKNPKHIITVHRIGYKFMK
ncbi:MAG: response regulator transcription factor [Candidatus Omnitrophica bacterium]|nr:response regulator transcription factor [Candidatus Omnitrophota bacterium]